MLPYQISKEDIIFDDKQKRSLEEAVAGLRKFSSAFLSRKSLLSMSNHINSPTNIDLIVKVLSFSKQGILVHDGQNEILVPIHHFQGRKGNFAKLRSIARI